MTLTYQLHRAGGRVKSAGLGLDMLYPAETLAYLEQPGADTAGRLRSALGRLQEHPPSALLSAFFPQDRATIRQNLLRAGLYRPFLKTDQGPPGTFLPFVTAADVELRPYRIARREGVAVPEAHLAALLFENADARDIAGRVTLLYRSYELRECATALQELAQLVGFSNRRVAVGRGLFFYCNASAADAPITVPEHVCARVEGIVNELMQQTAAKAGHARRLYRDGSPLPEALARAESADPVEAALYFQADVYVTLDGDVVIERVQLPDVGLFLTELPSDGYEILPQVQHAVRPLRDRTAELLADFPSPSYLITRPEVLDAFEDTLEHLEIRALRAMAASQGVELTVGSLRDAHRLPTGARVLLLNVDLTAAESAPLLGRCARGELSCSPDPFLKLLAAEMTTQRRVPAKGRQLEHLLRTIRPGGQMHARSYHEMHRGIDRIYQHGAFTADVLHVDVPGESTPVPTLRHSIHSFTSLYNTCRRHGFPELCIREVPVTRENAFLRSDTGPHLAGFRFYFTRA
jgi:hypothetical protein